MEQSIYSLLPPLLAILMVILTRRVLLSLGTGIIVSALLLGKGNVGQSLSYLWDAVKGIFVEDGGLNSWNICILAFLFLLGAITALINIAGGSRAFGEWAMTKVKSRTGAQILTAIFGIIIFIDDYFNALAVGQVARPITDRHRVSRAKLAYLIDSTSAPICVISPISSWGAFIIGIIGTVLATHNITEISAFTAFLQIIPMNLYVWATLGLVFIIAIRNADFGAMRTHEKRTLETGIPYDPNKAIPGEIKEDLPSSENGTVGDLVWPIVALFAGTIAAIIWSGLKESKSGATIMDIFGNADVALALIFGGLFGLIVAAILFLRQKAINDSMDAKLLFKGIRVGMKSMLPAVMILVFAWAIITLIEELGTGVFLGDVVKNSQLNISFLPVIMFAVAGLMAFATGTSWGSFGILLPIAGQVVAATDMSMMLPALAAVLAGSVFGDHCSPISDTTILSSTGAGCNHMDHVITQLPYALTSALIAGIGFVVMGLTDNGLLGLATVAILLGIFALTTRKNKVSQKQTVMEENPGR
ncbi:Na+/H+ antiporter [Siminovitchia terrae]|uniref:Na+/H+ antiporter n=1 Tax=Siminovitchia terrae TaxID=1914933 RepID=A0A429X667_SIMTE|nr:Na+/H+ antiporter NhaC family protein [Siminovitchia terrae]RST58925.1 Na+/H+ antiporter NhaC family protein [Siminovitchia terrae]GIN89007.1 Na+/H+ antiporter [Siminovitchia terrae]GIN95076.1 Na+/H+ antiporter [Siminovitchia terrae]